jgi:L-threonylcarbamoyladenylate synthase
MRTEISQDLDLAVKLLRAGEVVAVPTETVYGLAANGFDPDAVRKIFLVKERPSFNPLILHFSSKEKALEVLSDVPPWALKLMDELWPGPLTLVLPKKRMVPNEVTSGKATVAVRVPSHKIIHDLLCKLDFPLAAPSANLFGRISPTLPEHVLKDLDGRISLIIEGGQCDHGIESTIIGMDANGLPTLLRRGSIPKERIEHIIGKLKEIKSNEDDPLAPGMLKKHYAPQTPSFLVKEPERWLSKFDLKKYKIGVVRVRETNKIEGAVIRELSATSDLNEAARQLYKVMHDMDVLCLDFILFEEFPGTDLGPSLNDKLKRATKPLIQLRKFVDYGLTPLN